MEKLVEHRTVTKKARNLVDMEKNHIIEVLEDTKWKIEGETGAAEILGVKPSTLRSRLQKLQIKRPKEWN
jgi:transcriptional regulator with GAF, ATPase, and Fis domain